MFDRHRQKAVILFALADVILTVCAFEAAYQTRVVLPLPRAFFIVTPVKALLLGGTLALWLGIGVWLGVYHKLYGNNTRAAIRDTFLQVFFGVIGLVTFQYLLDPQLDISRLFIGLFAAYNLVLLLVYRVSAGRLRGFVRRQFGAQTFLPRRRMRPEGARYGPPAGGRPAIRRATRRIRGSGWLSRFKG